MWRALRLAPLLNDNPAGVYVPHGLNQYTHIAGQPLGYDGQANLINDGTQVYTYDAENRLLTTSGTTASSFVYDPNGRLFQSTIGGTVTQYVYDGDALIGEYNGSGTLQRRYVHGDQVDEPLVQYNSTAIGASNRRYLHTDHQGSIIAHSDSSGSVFATNGTLAYDAYGIAAAKNNSVVGAFGYTGQVYFPSLGLNYYKARFYHPKLGRFLQTDPIGYKDNMNLYAYTGNDPVNATDPTGTQCFAMTHGIGSVCAGAGLSLSAPDKSTRNATQVAKNEIENGKETLKETAQLTAAVATTVVAPELVTLKIGSLLFKGEKAVDTIKVFRAFGGDARAGGFSWTTKDPRTVSNFRDAAGLPSGGASGSTNTANFLLKGETRAGDIIESRSALPLDGNRGGLPELIIDPKNVNMTDFFVLKP